MNSRHFTAIVRMRWQMMHNRFRRSGEANRIISIILIVGAALSSLSLFVFAAGWGTFFLAMLEPFYVIYVWDVVAAAFLFAWTIALMVELQRSELLSLKNLLHLPISLSGAFFLNYTSSLASLTVLLFLPAMLGLCVASVVHFGSKSVVVFALLAAFLFMVSAVSYQLRGWLARMMENKRKRGTVIAITTIAFVLVFQIPTMLNLSNATSLITGPRGEIDEHLARLGELERQKLAGEIEAAEWARLFKAERAEFEQQQAASRETETAAINRTATVVNAVLPIGWLPYGASAAADGAVGWPWLCVLGMSTIGLGSLGLAYRSTLRVYTGEYNKSYRPVARKSAKVLAKRSILETSVPLMSDTQSAITMATFRTMLRAPEAKMALLTPLIFACVFGSTMFTWQMEKLPDLARPWLGLGALGISLFGMVQLLLNMFGLDRQGFRAYVLMPTPRRDILLGKNMGVFPVAGTLSAVLIVFVGVIGQMHVTHVVATLLQIVVSFFIYCIIGNYTSIVAPVGLTLGSMRPASMKLSVVAMQFAATLLVPVAILPAALALAAELLASEFGGIRGFPIYLLLTFIELPIVLWFYNTTLSLQGRHLQEREQKILEVVSKVAD